MIFKKRNLCFQNFCSFFNCNNKKSTIPTILYKVNFVDILYLRMKLKIHLRRRLSKAELTVTNVTNKIKFNILETKKFYYFNHKMSKMLGSSKLYNFYGSGRVQCRAQKNFEHPKTKGLGLKVKILQCYQKWSPKKKVFTKHEGWNFSGFVDLKKQLNQ